MKKLLTIVWLLGMAAGQSSAPAGGVPQKESGANSSAATQSEAFTASVANDLLYQLADGMESRNSRLTLSVFDSAKLADYSQFSRQVSAWMRDHSSFRVYYKLRQVTADGARGTALVDFAYEAQPVTENAQPVRRHEQLRLTFERGAHGWKIVDVSPRAFFS